MVWYQREIIMVSKDGVIRLRPNRGSKKYCHLINFLERRRLKKRQKRCTLNPLAQVSSVRDDHDDDIGDGDDDDVVSVVLWVKMRCCK